MKATVSKRELAELRRKAAIGRRVGHSTLLGWWKIPGVAEMRMQIETARQLGYVVEVYFVGDEMHTVAKSWVQV